MVLVLAVSPSVLLSVGVDDGVMIAATADSYGGSLVFVLAAGRDEDADVSFICVTLNALLMRWL